LPVFRTAPIPHSVAPAQNRPNLTELTTPPFAARFLVEDLDLPRRRNFFYRPHIDS